MPKMGGSRVVRRAGNRGKKRGWKYPMGTKYHPRVKK